MEKTYTPVTTAQELTEALAKCRAAQEKFAAYTQEQVDKIFLAAATAANRMRIPLAKQAVAETGMGVVEDKVIKNHYAAEYIYNAYKDSKTCGVIEEDTAYGIQRIAEPIGVIAAVIPTTNPTSTAIFKTLISLKTRNGIIISPHPRAKGCTIAAARVVLEAAVAAGAPEGIIAWIDKPSLELTNQVMAEADLILATGGPGMVKAAYSSGKPAIGVGAGNGPAYIHRSADVAHALACIARSKSFDYGTVCASEQSIIVEKDMEQAVRSEAERQGFYFMDTAQAGALAKLLFRPNGTLNPDIVGKPAAKLAEAAGFSVPNGTKVLVAREQEAGPTRPYSMEKLCPVLALFVMDSEDAVLSKCMEVLRHEGSGHTFAIHATDETVIRRFASQIPVSRFLVNTPAALGGIGATTGLFPALTLGCGAVGGSSSSNNISPLDLINIRRVAWDLGENPTVPQGGAAAGAVNAELVELLTEKILQRLGE